MNLSILKQLPQNSSKKKSQSPVQLLNANVRTVKRSLTACLKVCRKYEELMPDGTGLRVYLCDALAALEVNRKIWVKELYKELGEEPKINKYYNRGKDKVKL